MSGFGIFIDTMMQNHALLSLEYYIRIEVTNSFVEQNIQRFATQTKSKPIVLCDDQ